MALTSANQTFNYTHLSSSSTKWRAGFNIGAYVEFFDTHSFTLVSQLEYEQKGMVEEIVNTEDDPVILREKDINSRLDYLSVPLLGKIYFSGKSLTPFFLAGPRVDFFLGYNSDDNFFNPVYDEFKKMVFGGTLGCGVEIPKILISELLVEIRYNADFTDSYNSPLLTVRNNAFDFWVGVKF
ncbi:MAG: PorT family protein [Ignavibacteriae bacterium]|nr:PorT family protein [Ignavibacteriota bacterium]